VSPALGVRPGRGYYAPASVMPSASPLMAASPGLSVPAVGVFPAALSWAARLVFDFRFSLSFVSFIFNV